MSKTIASIVKQLTSITSKLESNIISKIESVEVKVDTVNTRMDAMAKFVSQENKTIIQRLANLETHMAQPSQKCEAPKSVNTVQYNGAADNVTSIGTCEIVDYKTKKYVAREFFGFCKNCGDPILSPSVIAYCEMNKREIHCFPCQKGGKRTTKYRNVIMADGSTVTNTPVVGEDISSQVDATITMACDVCGGLREYKSSQDYIAKKAYAESLGLPGTMCIPCAKKARDEMKDTPAVPVVDTTQVEVPLVLEGTAPEPIMFSMTDMISYLVVSGKDADYITGLKIGDIRAICTGIGASISFSGNEWNASKKAMVDLCISSTVKEEVKAEEPVVEVPAEIDEPVNMVSEDDIGNENQGF